MSAVNPVKALLAAAIALVAAALWATPVVAAPAPQPAWSVDSVATPTVFVADDAEHEYSYEVAVFNQGGERTDGSPIAVTDTLPKGLTVTRVKFEHRYKTKAVDFGEPVTPSGAPETIELCKADEPAPEVQRVTCTLPEEIPGSGEESALLYPSEQLIMHVYVSVPVSLAGQTLQNEAKIEGAGAAPAQATSGNPVAAQEAPEGLAEVAPAGFAEFQAEATEADGTRAEAAASHPFQFTTDFSLNTKAAPPGQEATIVPAGGALRDLPVALPAGFSGGSGLAETATRCTAQQFTSIHGVSPVEGINTSQNDCPDSSAIGLVSVRRIENVTTTESVPLYNLAPAPGDAATFGFAVVGALPIYIDVGVRPDDGYRAYATVRNGSQAKRVITAGVTIWGDPADEIHDPIRGDCLDPVVERLPMSFGECPAGVPEAPFLRLPTSCAGVPRVRAGVDTWSDPGVFFYASSFLPTPTGCAQVPFGPTLTAHPTTRLADSPTGFEAHLHVPQPDDPKAPGEADLRKTVVTLPEGLVINPSGANGLGACSEAQIGYLGQSEDPAEERFSDAPDSCPAASRVGTVTVRTPLIDHPLEGSVYVAEPHANPFGGLLAIYLSIDDPRSGIVVKLAGHVEPDPSTGRLKTTFSESPQQPFEDFELDFFGGPKATLRTPAVCGAYATESTMTPWSAPEAPAVSSTDRYAIDRGAGGGDCPGSKAELPGTFSYQAGTESPLAAIYSPLVLNLTRPDGSREFGRLTLTPPPGLLARLAGIPYCPEADLAKARSREREGGGREEQAAPSCPLASQVGTVQVGAGAGPDPYYAQGAAYLAGPYEGAPLSLAIVTPATAGPFDLGTVVVRTAVHVDPATARITAVSDPIPHVIDGIPVDVRSISVRLDHPGWGLNPTNCEPFSFDGTLAFVGGSSAPLSNPFQVGECARLGFKPSLRLHLRGATSRGAFPALHAVYTPREGDANLKSMALRFPRSEFIEQGHFRTICTRVAYAAGEGHGKDCPPGSVYGHVSASTPLLSQPLEGPVYLRSSSHNLPDVVFALNGQVDAEVAVRIDAVRGGLRATIESAPDVPVSKVLLDMQGGQKGLFVNSRDICANSYRADARLAAQNGRTGELRPAMQDAKCGAGRRSRRKKRG